MKPSKLIVYLVCTLLAFLITRGASAQEKESTFSNSPSPPPVQSVPGGHITGPLIMNNGIVRPLENLDLFQYSNLKKNNGNSLGQGTGGTTFGKVTVKRKSNIELNKPKEDKAKDPQVTEELSNEATQAQAGEESELSFTSLPPLKSSIYTWTDKDGVKHFTNNIDSVPSEYRDQMVEKGGEQGE